jgi:hypothetical protein
MLGAFVAHTTPWPHWTTEAALTPADLARVRAAFGRVDAWDRHETFYQAFMGDLTPHLPPTWGEALTHALAPRLGAPLLPRFTATAQRMLPGDHARPHTDRPLVGYEAARVVLQLTDAWTPAHGGWFEVFDAPDRPPTRRRAPRANSAVAFLLRDRAWHAVTPTAAPRATVVLNLWHAGNPPALADTVHAWFDGIRHAHLPRALDPIAIEAEGLHDEDVTAQAADAAWIALRWGFDDAAILAAYRAALPAPGGPPPPVPAALAAWVARLRRGGFDPDAWATLGARVSDAHRGDVRLRPALDACFPRLDPHRGSAAPGC